MGEKNKLKLITADTIEPKEVRWLWYPFIPEGKVTIIQGDPGDGKSTFMLTLAALMTKGEPFPFSGSESVEPRRVIYQTSEDDAADTVVPRFLRAGGDPKLLTFIDESDKTITFADERIAEAIRETNARMLILDPLSAYIGDCSLNQANEVRPEFNHLRVAAQDTGCAIVVVDHMNKASQLKAMYRSKGSIDIIGVARSGLILARDPEDDGKRILVQQKANLAPLGHAISFSISEEGIVFLEELRMTADELLSAQESPIGRPPVKMQEAVSIIKELLPEGSKKPSVECEEILLGAGYQMGTIKRAKKIAGVESRKEGGRWFWMMPARSQEVNKYMESIS